MVVFLLVFTQNMFFFLIYSAQNHLPTFLVQLEAKYG